MANLRLALRRRTRLGQHRCDSRRRATARRLPAQSRRLAPVAAMAVGGQAKSCACRRIPQSESLCASRRPPIKETRRFRRFRGCPEPSELIYEICVLAVTSFPSLLPASGPAFRSVRASRCPRIRPPGSCRRLPSGFRVFARARVTDFCLYHSIIWTVVPHPGCARTQAGHWERTSTKAKPFFWMAFLAVFTIWRGW